MRLPSVAVAVVGGLAGLAFLSRPPAAFADTTVNVTTTVDEINAGDGCSLREAIAFASGDSGAAAHDCGASAAGTTTVVVPAGCYGLTLGQLTLGVGSNPTVIQGAGPGALPCDGTGTVIDAHGNSRAVFVSDEPPATMIGLTVTGGQSTGGGGIDITNSGRLTLSDVLVAGNRVTAGAGGVALGTAGGPGGNGGGIYDSPGGSLTLIGSTVSNNTAGNGGTGADSNGSGGGSGGRGGSGGGIFVANVAQATLSDSTVSDNRAGNGGIGGVGGVTPTDPGGNGGAGGDGGGVATATGGGLTMTNVTVAGNAAGTGGSGAQGFPFGQTGAGGGGGGIRDLGAGAIVSHVTIAANAASGAGAGVDEAGSTNGMSATASVIAGNSGQNCTGPFTNGGANITDTGGLSDCPGAVADPRLGQLAHNGGPTETIALRAGSAAIDLVAAGRADCPGADQRGLARPQGAGCDAGAYEWAPPRLSDADAHATGVSTAVVSASVNPNLRDSSVTARYGETTGYGSVSRTKELGSTSKPVPATITLTGLKPGTTYHAQLLATSGDGSTGSSDLVFTTGAAPHIPVVPSITALRQSARRWVEGRGLARISAKRRLPIGTTFSFRLTQAATVTLTFTRNAQGHKVKGRCVGLTRKNRRRPACSRLIPSGSLSFLGHPGVNKVSFQGRLSRTKALHPGNYTLRIIAANAVGRSSRHSLSFTIVA